MEISLSRFCIFSTFRRNSPFLNNMFAASRLKVQHIPLSVGMVLKMAEHGTFIPFQTQALSIDLVPFASKQGS